MVALGLLAGEVPALIETGAYKQFYMHRTSHWLGMDVHDVGVYSVDGAARPLVPGMVLTIEPGPLRRGGRRRCRPSCAASASASRTTSWSPTTGYDNLTASTPKSVADIEAITA